MAPPPHSSFRRAYEVVLLGFVLMSGLVLWNERSTSAIGIDLAQWVTAAQLIRDGRGSELYQQDEFFEATLALDTGHGYYSLYPPQVAVFFVPATLVPFELAVNLFRGLQLVCLAYSVCALLRFQTKRSPRWHSWCLALGFLPIAHVMLASQLSVLLLTLLVIATQRITASKYLTGGMILSLLAIKPTLFVGVGIWSLILVKRAPKIFLGILVGSALQAFLVFAVSGMAPLIEYARLLPELETFIQQHYRFGSNFQHGLKGALQTLDALPVWLISLMHLAELGICTLALFAFMRRYALRDNDVTSDLLGLPMGVVFAVTISPHVLTYDLAVLLLPILIWHDSSNVALRVGSASLFIGVNLLALGSYTGISPVPFVLLSVVLSLGAVAFRARP